MPLTNSDMVFNNHFHKNLLENAPNNQVFTIEQKEAWKSELKQEWFRILKLKNQPLLPLDLQKQCSICFKKFYDDSWLLDWNCETLHSMFNDKNKFMCYFCSEFHCRSCMV